MTAFVMVILLMTDSPRNVVTTQEFFSREACDLARTAIVEAFKGAGHGRIRVLCLPK